MENLRSENVLVTGASCPLGSAICHTLVSERIPVIAVVRNSDATRFLPEMETLIADCTELDTYRDALRSATIVIHVAGLRFASTVIRGLAGHGGLKRVLFIGSARVHYNETLLSRDERQNQRVLREQEELIVTSQLPWTVLRPTWIYSERDRSISKLVARIKRSGYVPIPGKGSALRQPIAATDLADSTLKALLSSDSLQKAYDVPGCDITVREMMGSIAAALDRDVRWLPVPRMPVALAKRAFALLGSEPRAITSFLRWFTDIRVSPDAAQADFGHAPKPFDTGIRQQLGRTNDHPKRRPS